MVEFEIGVVYEKANRLFIAVGPSTLISCRGGTAIKIKPSSRYSPIRSISVEKICDRWNVSLARFDSLMSGELAPTQSSTKTRPRGSRRTKREDDDYWSRHRTGRILRSKS